MDTKVCNYIVTIAECGSVALAAERLYVTQSALNQMLLKLENELGTALFVRIRNHWTLTPAGQVYVDSARRMIALKESTYAHIEDLAKKWKGTIRIGLTPERGMQMFAAVYSGLHERYPQTIFQPIDGTVDEQNELFKQGQLDLAIQTVGEKRYRFLTYHTILHEPFVLCVPRSHPLAYREILPPDQFPTISLNAFSDQVFTLVRTSSNMRQMVDRLFERAGFTPRLLFNSAGMRAMQKLAANGQCCCIIPRFYAIPSENVAYFLLGDEAKWQLAAVYRNDHYLNAASRDFIHNASEYFRHHLNE